MQDAAQNPGEYEFDVTAERFFSQPPAAWESEEDEWQLPPLSSLERMAILLTLAPVIMSIAAAIVLLFCTGL